MCTCLLFKYLQDADSINIIVISFLQIKKTLPSSIIFESIIIQQELLSSPLGETSSNHDNIIIPSIANQKKIYYHSMIIQLQLLLQLLKMLQLKVYSNLLKLSNFDGREQNK